MINKIIGSFQQSTYTLGAFDLGQVPVMLDENFTLFMKNLLIFEN